MATSKARVLLVSLNRGQFFDEVYEPICGALMSKATLERVEEANTAIRKLSDDPPPSAVLIADAALTLRQYTDVWDATLRYIHYGGTAVVMGNFPSFVRPDIMKSFFARAGLSWEAGSYHRTTLILNRDAAGFNSATALSPRFSQKALFVRNVANSEAWYKTDECSIVESLVFAPTSTNTVGETAVALARVGDGNLGYVGDVNIEEGSVAVILAMCGLGNVKAGEI
ncbi:hypothetical protein JDV02_003135 [Purpureocillium takamizusanense]|uniref:Triacylglycerol lipase n=1 Tax=Purpureocillium takamizusanense TaxID=2060973 RepID=A0A9Q8QCC7_9HYPO|nr:uncharacterized protein JDV02_003135 [Purpureocillium takamizusanense]UNI16723.1 hypothetical protein JDV02_003135 [Purpureocillium takamizusanense]